MDEGGQHVRVGRVGGHIHEDVSTDTINFVSHL
jgi:hypothetical protein